LVQKLDILQNQVVVNFYLLYHYQGNVSSKITMLGRYFFFSIEEVYDF
jgi:hypothetical protein